MEAIVGLFFLFFIWVTYLADKWRSERRKRLYFENENKDLRFENRQLNKMLLKYGKEEIKEAQGSKNSSGNYTG